ncbi:MAG: aconitate hydratase, partial [Thermoplasmata archaeon]
MQGTITYQILAEHLREGVLEPTNEIGIQIDQTLTQDATGTIAYLQFMKLGLDRIRAALSVSYVDHNTLQTGFENADDHLFLQSVAARYGIYFSRPGNGICHQVHLERFGVPGKTLVGSDSHTPTAGALGMLGIGAGGLDVAIAMAGGHFFLNVPEVFCINMKGKLQPWVNTKDVILIILGEMSVTGGVGKIIEYSGDGVENLSVPQRATMANMGAELGATSSIFPSDKCTSQFLQAQGRSKAFRPIAANKDAEYEGVMNVDLAQVVPSVACPHSPDLVKPIEEVAGTPVDQVVIGSCTNSSLRDLITVAEILKGKTIHPDISLVIAPGSRQVLTELAKNGALSDIISAGGRILECACGPCIGMGHAPPSGGVSLRTFNRNFKGRCGTADAEVYLGSPETAVATALTGVLTDPRDFGVPPKVTMPKGFAVNDSMIIPPLENRKNIKIRMGPNIKPLPLNTPLPDSLKC